MGASEVEITAFLAASGWGAARRGALAGDASARRYERLAMAGQTVVLMIAAPGDEFARFQRVATWLLDKGFSAPRILAADNALGLMLLEDFGDDLFARLLARSPNLDQPLYTAITDFLLDLHRQPPPEFLTPLDGPALAALAELAVTWFPKSSAAAAADLPAAVAAAYARIPPVPAVLSLRDFHAENVIWLPARGGSARLGLLDFQDAVLAHPAYDLVSALQDARRDVAPAVELAQRNRYARHRGFAQEGFEHAYAMIGAQRALRILGVFARLGLALGKPQYLPLIPRVWSNLQRNLAHPGLEDLRAVVQAGFAVPDEAMLARMTHECQTRPRP